MQYYVVVRTQLLCGAFALYTAWKERGLTSCNGRHHHMRIPCKARTSCSRSGLDQHQHKLLAAAASNYDHHGITFFSVSKHAPP